jgi:hypothetical protein
MQPTTGVQWEFCLSMMLLMSHLSIVCAQCISTKVNPLIWPLASLLTLVLILTDIRNWIRNIEQHASDNVNKILVGNKADMDESKRVCSFFPLLSHIFCLCNVTFLFKIFLYFYVQFKLEKWISYEVENFRICLTQCTSNGRRVVSSLSNV